MGLEKDLSPERPGGVMSEFAAWRARALNALLTTASVLGAPVAAWTVYLATIDPRQWTAALVFVGLYLFVLALTVFRGLDLRIRAWGFLLVGYIAGVVAFARGGLAGDGRIFLLVLPALALILIGVRSSVLMAALSLLTFALFALLARQGWVASWLVRTDNPLNLEPWLYGGGVFAMLLTLLLLMLWRFYRFQLSTLESAREAAEDLREAHTMLQRRATDLEQANRALQEHARGLEIAAEVARQITAIREEGLLIDRFINLIADRFVLYHVGLFRVDRAGDRAVLQMASSQGGKRLVERGYYVSLDSDDPVAQALREWKPLVRSVSEPIHELRWTRWRVVLPLRGRGTVLGALDVHIADERPPSEEQVRILQMLSDQFAVGLENAQLLEQTQRSLEELSRVYQAMTVEAWQTFVEEGTGVRSFWMEDSSIPEEVWRPLFEEARLRGEPVGARIGTAGEGRYALAVPVKLRDVPIGVIGFHRPVQAGEWQPREIALAEGIAERMALALENVRLLEETRRRAARERIVSEITASMARFADVEGVLRAAVRELGRLPNVVEAAVHLVPQQALTEMEAEAGQQEGA